MCRKSLTMLGILHPQIIRFDGTAEEMQKYEAPGYRYTFLGNNLKLPKWGIPVKESIRELVVFDIFTDLYQKYNREHNA